MLFVLMCLTGLHLPLTRAEHSVLPLVRFLSLLRRERRWACPCAARLGGAVVPCPLPSPTVDPRGLAGAEHFWLSSDTRTPSRDGGPHTGLMRLRISWALPCHGVHRTADHLGQCEYAAAMLTTVCFVPTAALVSPRVIAASSAESWARACRYIMYPRLAAEERGGAPALRSRTDV
ncbi:hypothetical protein FB451DRAFT_1518201 [Mycena latifolia]|nr:hypothetical protein FB451DRAFT_1518201 [Mycena latifolia]